MNNEATDRAAWVNGLHDLANFIDTHPSFPLPDLTISVWLSTYDYDDTKAEVARLARQLGRAEKNVVYSTFVVSRDFGPHKLKVETARDAVCVAKVVGTEEVEIPDYSDVPTKKVTRDIVEWECSPLLAD